MATGNFVLDKGYDAAAAITKFRAVKLTAAETVGPVSADTDLIHGWAQFGVATSEIARGKGASVRVEGITEAEAAAAVAVGQLCTINASGQVVPAVTGKRVAGRCVGHAATNSGDRISLLINPNGPLAP